MNEKRKEKKSKRKFSMPNVVILLLFMMFLAMITTWLVPAGSYDRIEGPEGRMIVEPNSYSKTESTPVGIFSLFKAIPQGLTDAGMIAWTIIIIGGAFQVLSSTGAITVGMGKIVSKFKSREVIIIPIIMIIFSSISAIIGAGELALVYVPIMIALCFALKLDTLTAVSISIIGVYGAAAASLSNPFTVGLAQQIAGLPLYSGIGFRSIVLVVFTVVGILYVLRYAWKVKKDPKNSLVYEENKTLFETHQQDFPEEKKSHKYIGLILILAFVAIAYGVIELGWFMFEIGAIFFIVAILSGIISRMSFDDITNDLIKGGSSVLLAALVVGLARGILIIIEDGGVIDTIIFTLVTVVQSLPKEVSVIGIFIAQSLFNFIVPSGSGQILITMPILSPVSEVVGITQQTTVLATQLGDGITNVLYPVSGTLMAALAYAKVPYLTWAKFIFPLILIWSGLACFFLVIAQLIQYGPF